MSEWPYKEASHQCVRDEGSSIDTCSIPGPFNRQCSSVGFGLLNIGVLSQQARGHSIFAFLHLNRVDVGMGRTSQSRSSSKAHPSKMNIEENQFHQWGQSVPTEWSLHPPIFDKVCCQ